MRDPKLAHILVWICLRSLVIETLLLAYKPNLTLNLHFDTFHKNAMYVMEQWVLKYNAHKWFRNIISFGE